MIPEQIDRVKQQYTDKYVVVDAQQPELARFGEYVGQVKTVNMSGRALVEFMDYHLNTGWIDIDLDYLKVVDKPEPKEKKPAAKKPAAKPAAKKAPAAGGEKKLSPLEMARMQGAGGKGAAAPAKKIEPTVEKAQSTANGSAAKTDRSKMSVADMLAAARGEKSGASATAEAPAATPAPVAEASPAAGDVVKVDRSSMSVDEMVAYCREKDAQ